MPDAHPRGRTHIIHPEVFGTDRTNKRGLLHPLEGMRRHSWQLMAIDLSILIAVELFMLVVAPSSPNLTRYSPKTIAAHMALCAGCVFGLRLPLGIYNHIWRYGNTALYLRLMLSDAAAGLLYFVLQTVAPITKLGLLRCASMVADTLVLTVFIRLVYQYVYALDAGSSPLQLIASALRGSRAGEPVQGHAVGRRIQVAVVGAGRVGVTFAKDLLANPRAAYQPVCFIDTDPEKAGRYIAGLRTYGEEEVTAELVASFPIQEFVFAIPDADAEQKQALYERYRGYGCRMKVYDYPMAQSVEGGKRQLREFGVEELLFRSSRSLLNEETRAYYRGKTVLITGGGGSIGSELARQIARAEPKRLILLDVYENAVYDIQQELRMTAPELDLKVVICSVCSRDLLREVFAAHRPDEVIHAAAHKHVPLMEDNVCEAVRNNVFGTLNVVDLSEEFGVKKAIMVSTDKAVNPTNVMGATKRLCEMIFQSRRDSRTVFACTRFGNVLGSNGSVIPLFRRQIAAGGPITLTDRRVIRYFMTIPEASQLVLQSGAMAGRGDLYVLDMGKPVKILDLAENMVRLSGLEPYRDIDIVETGLRPGEKLYEELLISTDQLERTANRLIFVEHPEPISREEIARKLEDIEKAMATLHSETVREALRRAVPTYRRPEEVNGAFETEDRA